MISEGQTLDGTYHLQRLVGEGGMGAVYEATHARLAGRYAIKVLQRSLADSPEAQALFDREARITSMLQHPNVVQVIDHNTTADGIAYLVMEYLQGESLAARLTRVGRLDTPAVVDVVDQVGAGLAAAHAHGIVHRDLKPENIFLVPVEGRATELAKILDFGISKVNWGSEAIDTKICGTPEYMAPEQREGRAADVDDATDQFALAAIAHELLTGHRPFVSDGAPVVEPTGLPGLVDSVLARGMARSNATRFASVTEFAAAFRAAALTAAAVEVVARAPRRSRRPQWGLRLGIAVAAGVATTVFFRLEPASRPSVSGPAPVVVGGAEPVLTTTVVAEERVAPRPAMVPPPAVVPARARRQASRTPAVETRPRPAVQLSADEDATLPMSETVAAF